MFRYRWGPHDAYDLQVIGYSDPKVARKYRQPKAAARPTFILDKTALLELYTALRSPHHWPGWNQAARNPDADPCLDKWQGVACNNTRVVSL